VPAGDYAALLDADPMRVFGELSEIARESDFAFLNLEAPVVGAADPIAKSGPHMRVGSGSTAFIRKSGFNIAGLANNHIRDFGNDGIASTLAACRSAGIHTVGAGEDLVSAQTPLILRRNSLTIALVAVSEREFSIATSERSGAAPLEVIDIARQIEELRGTCDFIFLTVHGGVEYLAQPSPSLRKTCRFLVEQGADAILCHHSHVPGAWEVHKGAPIFYSLGNMLFDNPAPPAGWNYGYAVRFRVDIAEVDRLDWEIFPFEQRPSLGGIRLLNTDRRTRFFEEMERQNCIVGDDAEYGRVWNAYCATRKSEMLFSQYVPFRIPGLGLLSSKVPLLDILSSGKRIHGRLNTIRCDSLRDVLVEVLEQRASDDIGR